MLQRRFQKGITLDCGLFWGVKGLPRCSSRATLHPWKSRTLSRPLASRRSMLRQSTRDGRHTLGGGAASARRQVKCARSFCGEGPRRGREAPWVMVRPNCSDVLSSGPARWLGPHCPGRERSSWPALVKTLRATKSHLGRALGTHLVSGISLRVCHRPRILWVPWRGDNLAGWPAHGRRVRVGGGRK